MYALVERSPMEGNKDEKVLAFLSPAQHRYAQYLALVEHHSKLEASGDTPTLKPLPPWYIQIYVL